MVNDLFRVTEPLIWRSFEGDWALYQVRSGAMIYLDNLGATVLSLLEAAPSSATALGERLADETGVQCTDDLIGGVAAVFEYLRNTGIISAVAGPPAW